ncbi:Putative transposable element [Caligus rogercresseyi]|uniref:Transposable element n=1 Tax=Caligus rogercresseyi TaxID=217165 RepID=A0A7T8JVS6_CALRO|nr:Putative transposable element [Caligus rogercresseyi]
MASERDTRVKVRALLDAGKTPTEISRLLGVARMPVYRIGMKDNIERKRGSGSKAKVALQVIKKALEAEPLKSMRAHAKDMGISHTTIVRSVKMLGEKSLVRVERPLLTERIKYVHLQRCQTLLNNLKSATAGRVIIFSDEKTWTVDPVRNRRNDCYLSFGGILTPCKCNVLGICGLQWHRCTTHLVLKTKFLPWVRENFHDGNVVFQQDGAPAHTALTAQNWLKKDVEFWPKDMWPPFSSDANPLNYAFWPHVQSKACTLRHANVEAMKASVNEHWTSMLKEYITKTCQAFRRRFEAILIADGDYIDN